MSKLDDTRPWAPQAAKVCEHLELHLAEDTRFDHALELATQLRNKLDGRKRAVPRALRERILNIHWLCDTLTILTRLGPDPPDDQIMRLLRLRMIWRQVMGTERLRYVKELVRRAVERLSGWQLAMGQRALTQWD